MFEQPRDENPPLHQLSTIANLHIDPSIIFIRHGKSAGNVLSSKLRAHPDLRFTLPPGLKDTSFRLTNLGRDQAAQTGEWLAARFPQGFDIIIASPFERAKQTAQIACEAAGWDIKQIVEEPLVRERSWGDIYTIDASERRKVLESFRKSPRDTRIPGGETLDETRARADQFLEKVRTEYPGKRVLVFSHGEFIQEALGHLADISDHHRRFRVKNCQVFELAAYTETAETPNDERWVVRSSWPCGGIEGNWEELHPSKGLSKSNSQIPELPNLDSID